MRDFVDFTAGKKRNAYWTLETFVPRFKYITQQMWRDASELFQRCHLRFTHDPVQRVKIKKHR